VVDKTGTLTEGRPRVTAVAAAAGWPEAMLLPLAAGLERASEHPLAAAVVEAARQQDLAIAEPGDFRSITGKGVTGTVAGRSLALGNRALLQDLGIGTGALEAGRRRCGGTVLPHFISPSTAASPASLVSQTRSNRRPPMRSTGCVRAASAS
jgi:Cu+-exporting ATPase